jgi:hypothetical protein
LIEADPVARYVDHRLASPRGIHLAVDSGDQGLVGRASHVAEFLHRDYARRAKLLDGVRAIRFDEVGEGPARLAKLHACQAEPDLIAGASQVALDSTGRGGGAGGGIEEVHIGRAIPRRDEASEVEARVLHDDRRRKHRPFRLVAAAAAREHDKGEQESAAAHAASLPRPASASQKPAGPLKRTGQMRFTMARRADAGR